MKKLTLLSVVACMLLNQCGKNITGVEYELTKKERVLLGRWHLEGIVVCTHDKKKGTHHQSPSGKVEIYTILEFFENKQVAYSVYHDKKGNSEKIHSEISTFETDTTGKFVNAKMYLKYFKQTVVVAKRNSCIRLKALRTENEKEYIYDYYDHRL